MKLKITLDGKDIVNTEVKDVDVVCVRDIVPIYSNNPEAVEKLVPGESRILLDALIG